MGAKVARFPRLVLQIAEFQVSVIEERGSTKRLLLSVYALPHASVVTACVRCY